MTNIPTFRANVTNYTVPSLNASGEFENTNPVYKGLASFADSSMKIAKSMYAIEQAEKAKTLGAEAGASENFDLSALPEASTEAQRAYNQAAVDSFAIDYNVGTTREIDRLKEKNRDNAQQFLVEADSFLRGSSEGVPERYKRQVLYPMQVHAEATYNSLLKDQMERLDKMNSERDTLNLYFMKNNLSNLNWLSTDRKEQEDNLNQFGNYISAIRSQTGKKNGLTPAQAITAVKEATGAIAYSYVTDTMKQDMTLKQRDEFFDKVTNGKTGNIIIDKMDKKERAMLVNAANDINAQMYEDAKKLDKQETARADSEVQSVFMNYYKAIDENPENISELTNRFKEQALSKCFTPKQRADVQKFFSNDPFTTTSTVKSALDLKVQQGTLEYEDLIQPRIDGNLSSGDLLKYTGYLSSPLAENQKRNSYKHATGQIKTMFEESDSLFGKKDNYKMDYAIQSLNDYCSEELRSEEEIEKKAEKIISEAKTINRKYVNLPKLPEKVNKIEWNPRYSEENFIKDSLGIDGKSAGKMVVFPKQYIKDIDIQIQQTYPDITEEEMKIRRNIFLSIQKQYLNEVIENQKGVF